MPKKMERMVLAKNQEVVEEVEAEAEAEAEAGAKARIDSSKCIDVYLSIFMPARRVGEEQITSNFGRKCSLAKNVQILVWLHFI
jgi:hypothetical protein